MIYTYQTNSFKIIKCTFSIYDLPHAPVIFLINSGIFNCFENSDRAENFRQTVPIYGWWGGGAVAPPEFPPLTAYNQRFLGSDASKSKHLAISNNDLHPLSAVPFWWGENGADFSCFILCFKRRL